MIVKISMSKKHLLVLCTLERFQMFVHIRVFVIYFLKLNQTSRVYCVLGMCSNSELIFLFYFSSYLQSPQGMKNKKAKKTSRMRKLGFVYERLYIIFILHCFQLTTRFINTLLFVCSATLVSAVTITTITFPRRDPY